MQLGIKLLLWYVYHMIWMSLKIIFLINCDDIDLGGGGGGGTAELNIFSFV